LVVTAMPGVPMSADYLRWRHTARRGSVAADFAIAGRWIAELQSETARDPEPLDMGQDVAEILVDRYANEPRLGACIRHLESMCERLRTNQIPRTAVHGDFWFGNVLTAGGRVTGVVDWELGVATGEPVRDLVRFPLMYALYLDRHAASGESIAGDQTPGSRWGAGIFHAIQGSGWFPDLFRDFIQGGLHRLGAAREAWRDAALAGVAEVAATTDDPEFGRRHLGLFHRLAESPAPNRKDRS
jgi:aminoglycoside phosphotransferase (APT) family kinase protein